MRRIFRNWNVYSSAASSAWLIAGATVGSVVGFVALVLLLVFILRRECDTEEEMANEIKWVPASSLSEEFPWCCGFSGGVGVSRMVFNTHVLFYCLAVHQKSIHPIVRRWRSHPWPGDKGAQLAVLSGWEEWQSPVNYRPWALWILKMVDSTFSKCVRPPCDAA